jgi:hypothetical protein
MEATCSSEISVDFQLATRCYIPDDRTVQLHKCIKIFSGESHVNVELKPTFQRSPSFPSPGYQNAINSNDGDIDL